MTESARSLRSVNPITRHRRLRRVRGRHAIVLVPLLLSLASCGSDSSQSRELVGYRPSGQQVVDTMTLPDASNGDAPFDFVARPGGLLVVYFGYTSCPDVCPTTLAMFKSALAQLGDDASRIDLAMATVDPNRDTADVITGYVQSFVPSAHALRTDQADELRRVADLFGVSYSVTTAADGTIEVAHSGAMYVVNDQGDVVLTWPFGVVADDVAADLEQLLAETSAA
jgi:protein SCO1/2